MKFLNNIDLTNGSGIIVSGTAGAALTAGDLVYFDAVSSNNKWEKTDANTVASCENALLGIVIANASEDAAVQILLQGIYITSGLTTGANWVSETAGAITSTMPTTSGVVQRIIGYAVSSTLLYFNPQMSGTLA